MFVWFCLCMLNDLAPRQQIDTTQRNIITVSHPLVPMLILSKLYLYLYYGRLKGLQILNESIRLKETGSNQLGTGASFQVSSKPSQKEHINSRKVKHLPCPS